MKAGWPHSGKTVWMAWLLGVTGLLLVGCGLLFDPFSLPFQDFRQLPQAQQLAQAQQLPEAQQRAPAQKAVAMQRLIALGLGMTAAAVATPPFLRRFRRRARTPG